MSMPVPPRHYKEKALHACDFAEGGGFAVVKSADTRGLMDVRSWLQQERARIGLPAQSDLEGSLKAMKLLQAIGREDNDAICELLDLPRVA